MQLGPNITNPIALTWYDADDLLVLDGAGDQTSLWEVPVDGQPATQLPGVLPGAISITANNARNALVIGMTQNRMEVSAGFVGPGSRSATAVRARRSSPPPSRSRPSPQSASPCRAPPFAPSSEPRQRYAVVMSLFVTDRLQVPPDIHALAR